MRKLIATLLMGCGLALGVLAFLPSAVAYVNGTVGKASSNSAVYTVSSTDGLVWCTVPANINIAKNLKRSTTASLFKCQSHFPGSVTLNFSIVTLPASLTGLEMSGSAVLNATDTGAGLCRSVNITASPNNNNSGTVTFKAATATGADFYTELYFQRQVTLTNNLTGLQAPGCP